MVDDSTAVFADGMAGHVTWMRFRSASDAWAMDRRVDVGLVPRSVTRTDRQIIEDSIFRLAPQLREVVTDLIPPNKWSAITAVIATAGGDAWLRLAGGFGEDGDAAGRQWLVVAYDDSRTTRRVRLPPGFDLTDVVGGQLIGIWRDEQDVEYVRVYREREDAHEPAHTP